MVTIIRRRWGAPQSSFHHEWHINQEKNFLFFESALTHEQLDLDGCIVCIFNTVGTDAKAPGYWYPQCWLDIHCIQLISLTNITFIVNTIKISIIFEKKISRVKKVYYQHDQPDFLKKLLPISSTVLLETQVLWHKFHCLKVYKFHLRKYIWSNHFEGLLVHCWRKTWINMPAYIYHMYYIYIHIHIEDATWVITVLADFPAPNGTRLCHL